MSNIIGVNAVDPSLFSGGIRPVGYEQRSGNSTSPAPLDHSHVVQLEDWQPLSVLYQNGWSDYGAGDYMIGQYLINIDGFVYIHGVITGGDITPNVILFQLPLGYRPMHQRRFVGCGGITALAVFDIDSDGVCKGRSGLDADNTSFNMIFEANRDDFAQYKS